MTVNCCCLGFFSLSLIFSDLLTSSALEVIKACLVYSYVDYNLSCFVVYSYRTTFIVSLAHHNIHYAPSGMRHCTAAVGP